MIWLGETLFDIKTLSYLYKKGLTNSISNTIY